MNVRELAEHIVRQKEPPKSRRSDALAAAGVDMTDPAVRGAMIRLVAAIGLAAREFEVDEPAGWEEALRVVWQAGYEAAKKELVS